MKTITDPSSQPGQHKKLRNADKSALDTGIEMPNSIAERLAQTRRDAVQGFEQQQRNKRRRKSSGATPWLAGAGLVLASAAAVVIVPQLQTTEPNMNAMPIGLIAADEDLEFFQTMDYLEGSLTNEGTS